MSEPTDWHRGVTFHTGEDIRGQPERPSQVSEALRHRRQVQARRHRKRRVIRHQLRSK